MERETKTIETPVDKQKVEIKSWLTGREKREINSVLFSQTSFSAEQMKNADISVNGDLINKMQDKLIEVAIVKVNGSAENLLDLVLNMRSQDFDFVISQIDALTKTDEELKKK